MLTFSNQFSQKVKYNKDMEKASKTSKFGKFQYIVYIYVRFPQPNFRNFYFLPFIFFS